MKALIVEDVECNRDMIVIVSEIKYAVNGKSAIEICKQWQPDVMILDNILPDIRGIEVLKEIAKFETCPKTIAISSDYSSAYIRAFKDLGAKGFIHKSEVTTKNFNDLINYILHKQEFWLSFFMSKRLADEQFAISKFAEKSPPKSFGEKEAEEYGFTKTEIKIIPYVRLGFSFKEIAELLTEKGPKTVEEYTVRNHITNIRGKVDDVYCENINTYTKLVAWFNRFILGEIEE